MNKRLDLKIQKLYYSGLSSGKIAKKLNLAVHVIKRSLTRTKTKIRPHGESVYKGARYLTPHGYIKVTPMGDDKKYIPTNSKCTTIMEHRLVMSRHLGRALLSNENVHHKNGNKSDNELDNLELWLRGQPSGARLKDQLIWAKSLLEFYKDINIDDLE